MKQLLFLSLFIIGCLNLPAQNARKDANGNYIAITNVRDSSGGKPTGKTFTTAKGEVFPVYESKTGKLYVTRVSKNTGKEYKQYLKLD
jgi:hypothetical protein